MHAPARPEVGAAVRGGGLGRAAARGHGAVVCGRARCLRKEHSGGARGKKAGRGRHLDFCCCTRYETFGIQLERISQDNLCKWGRLQFAPLKFRRRALAEKVCWAELNKEQYAEQNESRYDRYSLQHADSIEQMLKLRRISTSRSIPKGKSSTRKHERSLIMINVADCPSSHPEFRFSTSVMTWH